ncbi:hypothetical protein [Thermococcus sp.]|uniref:hypothetical protein n=1 Tax=Thermococcus sp. TaxID=35749 RepID=UPI00262B3E41|nr:hypothetical protein [Thermococcus sp.]
MGESEIVIRLKVPEEWDEATLFLVKRKLLVEITKELQERIEEAKKFEEILRKVRIKNQEEAKKLENEVKEALAQRYRGS